LCSFLQIGMQGKVKEPQGKIAQTKQLGDSEKSIKNTTSNRICPENKGVALNSKKKRECWGKHTRERTRGSNELIRAGIRVRRAKNGLGPILV